MFRVGQPAFALVRLWFGPCSEFRAPSEVGKYLSLKAPEGLACSNGLMRGGTHIDTVL